MSRCSTLRGSFSVSILCVSLSELLLGVVAPSSDSFRGSIHVCHVFVVVHVQYYPMLYHKQTLIQVKTLLDSTLKGGCHSLK